MNRLTKLMMSFGVVSLVVTGLTAYAEESEGIFDTFDISASGSLDFYSEYVWRGFTLDTDPVIQPGVNLGWGDLTFSFWSSWDADSNDEVNSDEIDYVIDYTKSFETFSVSVGHTYYDFPGLDAFSREFYVGLSVDELLGSPVSASLTYYYDYGEEESGGGEGSYVSLDFEYSLPVMSDPAVTFDTGLHFGYNNELFIAGDGFDLAVSGGFTIPLTANLTFSPVLTYSVPFADLEDENDGDQQDRLYGGFSMAYTF